METSAHEMHKDHYTTLNIEDRLRHFEAQAKLVDTLQKELNSAQVMGWGEEEFCNIYKKISIGFGYTALLN